MPRHLPRQVEARVCGCRQSVNYSNPHLTSNVQNHFCAPVLNIALNIALKIAPKPDELYSSRFTETPPKLYSFGGANVMFIDLLYYMILFLINLVISS